MKKIGIALALLAGMGLAQAKPAFTGTGIANFNRNSKGKWTIRKFYYEPDYKGGNHGFEQCAQR